MKRNIRLISFAIMALTAAVACKGKTEEKAAAAEGAVVEQKPLVSVAEAVLEDVFDTQTYSSSVQPWAKNNIAPQTGGRIDQLMVEIGNYVQAGEVVAKMEDVQLQQAELQVLNDENEFARISSLYKQGGVSQSDFEAFEMACKVHKSSYENLKKNTILCSPISGVISARNYDKGDMYAMAMPIYTVEQIVPVKMLIAVSEADYSRVKKGDKAEISVEAFPGQTFKGEITNIYPTMDATTHTFNAEVRVPNYDRKLRPGMYAKLNITFGNSKKVIVPDSAVTKQTGSGDRYVYILNTENNTVRYQKVELGRRLGNRYVINSGVEAGDKVVTEGILRLKNGIAVNVAE